MAGENIGTLLAAELALENDGRLYTRYNTDNRVIELFDQEGSIICESKLSVIINDINEALEDTDIVFWTLPSNAVPNIDKIIEWFQNIQNKDYLIDGKQKKRI